LPDQGYGVPVRVITARRVDDPREVITIGQAGLPIERLDDALAEVAAQARRDDQLDDVIESTQLRDIYEAIASDDLT
jgi:hypothetical protein